MEQETGREGRCVVRIAHTADWHLDERLDLDDTIRVLHALTDQLLEIHEERPFDVIVHAGDVYDRRSTPEVRLIAADVFRDLANLAPVVIVKGNHDAPNDLHLFSKLRAKHRITVAESLAEIAIPPRGGMWDNPEAWRGQAVGYVLAVPWFDKAQAVSSLERATGIPASSIREGDATVAAEALAILRAYVQARREVWGLAPVVAVGHLMIGGATTSTGQTLIGHGVEFAPGELQDVGVGTWLLGHVHQHQAHGSGASKAVCYSGSVNRLNYGEPEEKGWLEWKINPQLPDDEVAAARCAGGHIRVFHPLPARRLEFVEMRPAVEPDTILGASDVSGAHVRVRVRGTAEELAGVREVELEQRFKLAGAASVKVELVTEHATAVRSETVGKATDNWERFEAYAEAVGWDLDPDEVDDLKARLVELETMIAGGVG
jgi:exonuclease SbcD